MVIKLRNARRYGNGPGQTTGGESGGAGDTGQGSGGGDTGTGTPPVPPVPPTVVTLTPEQEAEVQRRADLAAGNVREQERKKYEKKLADDKASAEAVEAVKRGEFEKLYNEEKSAHETAKKVAEKAVTLAGLVHGQIETEVKEWPEEVRKTDPGKDADVEVRLAWANSHRDLANRLKTASRAPNGEHGKGSSGGTPDRHSAQSYINSTYPRPDQRNQPKK